MNESKKRADVILRRINVWPMLVTAGAVLVLVILVMIVTAGAG